MASCLRNCARSKGSITDFLIIVDTCEHKTIQGEIEHIKSGRRQSFRSALEMINLLAGMLDEKEVPQQATEIRRWVKEYPYLIIGGKAT